MRAKNDSNWGITLNRSLTFSSTIGRVEGVDNYVLVDDRGNILTHDMESPALFARLVHLWGQRLSTLGGKNFKYASLSRASSRDVLMFPVGNYYLGVVKQTGVDNVQLADAVMKLLDTHSDIRV